MIKKLMKNKLLVNSFYLMLSAFTHSAAGFFFYIIAARIFTAEDLGLSVNLLTSLSLIMVLSQFGFSESIIKFYKKSRDKERFLGTSLLVSAFLSLFFAMVVLFIICKNIPEISGFFTGSLIYPILFLAMSMVWAISVIYDSIFIAIGKSEHVLLKTIIFSIFKLLLPFMLIPLGFFGIYSSWTIASLFSLLFIQAKTKIRLKLGIDFGIIKRMLAFSFINYIGNIFYWLRNFLIPLIITLSFGAAQAAFFYVPLRLLDLMIIVPKSTGRALFAQSQSKNGHSSHFLAFFLSIASSLFFIILFFFFGEKILLVYGKEYMINSLHILKALSIYGLFMAANEILLTQAQHKSDSKEIIIIRVISSMISLLSIFYFRSYGLIGFAYAFLLGEIIAFLAILAGRLTKCISSEKTGDMHDA